MKKGIRILIAGIIGVALVVGYYYYLSNHGSSKQTEQTELTEIQKVTAKDLTKSYPKTPRAVVKFYNRIVCCYYNEECTDEDIEALSDQARLLLDQELLENNPKDTYLKDLKADIEEYRSNERKINNVTISDSDDITYKTVEGSKCAYVRVSYFIKEGKKFERTIEQFVLRQDEEKNWKILGFYQEEGDESSDDE